MAKQTVGSQHDRSPGFSKLVGQAQLCQSLGPAGAVWSYHPVAGANPEVSQSEMLCPVILGCTGDRHHKELGLLHLQRRTMNHTGPGGASWLSRVIMKNVP